MGLTLKQKGVAQGMATGFILSLLLVVLGFTVNPFGISAELLPEQRLGIFAYAISLPVLTLIICVGRLAKHRFFTPEDIDGSGLTSGSEEAKLLQSLLQNTLEQFCIALGVYAMACFLLPAESLSAVLLCSFAFAVGRISFIRGYSKGAPSRAVGFTLCFYSSAILWITTIVTSLI